MTQAHIGVAGEEQAQLTAGGQVGGGEPDEAAAHEPVGGAEVGHRVVVPVGIGAVERLHRVPEDDPGLDEDPVSRPPTGAGRARWPC